ncbi:hypothetical protein FEM03_14130 [Phragmitibacter flavus]|uniref:Hydrolase n=1 Tax=Phragmitibacter flavus TaxID=2576071 RepID=A0A5R8KDJ5_9BACT|nr:SGNH/GDSL hydrolase family protein [Phragmitibacter flavus]TLD70317.1 hypothetical protein FEM03_14130 [Phragmitibacter flavus]
MNRRTFFTATVSLPVLPLMGQQGAAPAEPISKLDKEMAASKAGAGGKGVTWQNPEDWGLEGRVWGDLPRKRFYDRLPAEAEGKVTGPVWNLSRHSAGMAVRFKTDATAVHVRYQLSNPGLAMPHMPATGMSGTDLYARDASGRWRWVNVSKPEKQNVEAMLIQGMPSEEREFMLYLPLYNGVEKLEIGVNEGAKFEGLAPREEESAVLFYGTSITHGASASRPGMCHPAILGRRLDRPVINLGFSGNGKMDEAVGVLLAKLKVAVLVIDCLPNMDAKLVLERCVPLVKQLRAADATAAVPIVLVEDRRNTNSWIQPVRAAHHTANHAALKGSFDKLKSEGVNNLFYVEGDALLGDDADGATDGSHPNDLGFYRQADVIEPVLRAALNQSV